MTPFDGGNSPGESGSATSPALRETRRIETAPVDPDAFPEFTGRPKFQGSDALMRTYMKEELYVSL